MKKKLITLLLAIFMIVPIVGCESEPDLSSEPSSTQTKIMLQFAERTEVEEGVYTYKFKPNELGANYSDCAELQGAGFYSVGGLATISIRYHETGCSFKGWVKQDGENVIGLHEDDSPYNYNVKNADAGKTLTFYAIMGGPKDTSQSLNVKDTQFELRAVRIKKLVNNAEFTFNDKIYNLSSSVVELENGDKYRLNGNEFVNVSNSSKKATISGDIVVLNGVTYTVNKTGTNVTGLSIKLMTLDDGSKYLYDGTKVFNAANNAECQIDKNDNIILSAIYTVVRDDYGKISGVIEGSASANMTVETLTDAGLVNYRFPTNDGSIKTFKAIADDIKTKKYPQKSTLSVIDPSANLSYYMDSTGKFQYYKVVWMYGVGKCSTLTDLTLPLDPDSTELQASANICIEATIDATQGITEEFLKNSIASTFYNQAYVDSVKDSACMTTLKADKNITESCMYIKNIGALTGVPAAENLKLENTNTYYYALTEDSLGNTRMEGIEQTTTGLLYGTHTYNVSDVNFYTTSYANKQVSYMKSFNLKFGPIYELLLAALDAPKTYATNFTFKYSRYTDSSVIESVLVDGTRYYFNYVASAQEHTDYFPTVEIGQTTHIFLGKNPTQTNLYKVEARDTETTTADLTVFNKLISILNANPQNLMNDDISKLENNTKELIFTLVNSNAELKALKKYEFIIEADSGTRVISVTAKNRLINIADFVAYQFAYDDLASLYLLYFEGLAQPTGAALDAPATPTFNHTKYPMNIRNLLMNVNKLSSQSALDTMSEWIMIESNEDDEYIDYLLYEYTGNPTLKYRIRYRYGTEKCFEVINLYTDRIVDTSFNFVTRTATVTLDTPTEVTDGYYKLTTISNYTITKSQVENINTYEATINGKKHIIDMRNLKVYNTVANEYYDLHKNLADDMKYYFKIKEGYDDVYYGVYYETPELLDPIFVLYKFEILDSITHLKGDKVSDMTKVDYLALDGGYYIISYDDETEEYTLELSADVTKVFKFEEFSVELTVKENIVKKDGKVVSDNTLEILKIFALLDANKANIIGMEASYDRYIILVGETIYELEPDSQSSAFFVIYNETRYKISFD